MSRDKNLAIDLYSKFQNINIVAKELNCDRTTLWRRLHSWNIKVKKSKHEGFDQYYFHNIDTEGKAYFFGLLMADGNNYTKQYGIISNNLVNKNVLKRIKENGRIVYKRKTR